MIRFSLKALVCLTAIVAIVYAVCFYGMVTESEDERDIRLYGELPIEDPETLFAKVDQLADPDERPDPWDPNDVRAKSRPKLTRVELAQVASHYRKAYPFVSLRDRLTYERAAKHRQVKLLDSTRKRLSLAEDPTQGGMMKGELPAVRTLAFEAVHSQWVFYFIRQEGVGMTRMPDPSIRDLESLDWPDIPFEATTNQPPGKPVEVPETEPTQPSKRVYELWAQARNPFRLPTRPRLEAYFDSDSREFGRGGRNGFARNVDEVAGFQPHRVLTQSRIRMGASTWDHGFEPEVSPHDWGVKSLQLVSLLKHDRPKVYVSKTLPNMESLPEGKTRDLDTFETEALDRLYDGEDLCIEGRENEVRMLGSLRAMKQCLDCHFVERGQLLGAFSYKFARLTPDPPESH